MYKQNQPMQMQRQVNGIGSLKSQFNAKRLNALNEDQNKKNIGTPPPTTPTNPTAPPIGTEPSPGYGEKLKAGPKMFFTDEIRDKDKDGIDDRSQTGPGGSKMEWGALSEEYQDYIKAGKPSLDTWNWAEYKKKMEEEAGKSTALATPSFSKSPLKKTSRLSITPIKSTIY